MRVFVSVYVCVCVCCHVNSAEMVRESFGSQIEMCVSALLVNMAAPACTGPCVCRHRVCLCVYVCVCVFVCEWQDSCCRLVKC